MISFSFIRIGSAAKFWSNDSIITNSPMIDGRSFSLFLILWFIGACNENIISCPAPSVMILLYYIIWHLSFFSFVNKKLFWPFLCAQEVGEVPFFHYIRAIKNEGIQIMPRIWNISFFIYTYIFASIYNWISTSIHLFTLFSIEISCIIALPLNIHLSIYRLLLKK